MITTVLEHNSVLRPLYEMEEKGVEVTILPCDEYGMVYPEDFIRASPSQYKGIYLYPWLKPLQVMCCRFKALAQQPGRGGSFLWWMPPRLPEYLILTFRR